MRAPPPYPLDDTTAMRLLEQATVAQAYPLFFANYAMSRGFTEAQVLEHTGLTLTQLQVPNSRIPAALHGVLVMNLLRLFQSEHIAIDMGLQSSLTKAGMIGFGLMSCATLREAVALGIRFLPTKVPFYTIDTSDDEQGLVCHIREAMPLYPVRKFAIENFMVEVWRLFESLFDPTGQHRDATGIELWFDWPMPSYYGAYASSLPVCRFDAPSNQIRIPTRWLDLKLPTANPVTAQMVIAQCEQEMALLGQVDDVKARVKNLLMCGNGQYPSVERIAHQLHTTPRTLKRRLQALGTSYTALLGEVVARDACRLLESTPLSVDEIAARVGYQDRANFTRAFKKLTGRTPTEHRQWALTQPTQH
ncbi:AraC family transcriptional regulator [Limnobacter humi]|uniref:AraC family transcriptional regulator n=1 Tax=Limnobacter humi TaxID=1778671 RepID=A0ABT1WJZ8_9BURK|nr:AraC family transcriptional regulator [Limnobacter humi]MCQ8897719.1 AraC family transcriptional regulator [Limnobacter humi]